MALDVSEGPSLPAAAPLSGRLAPTLISAALHVGFAAVLLGWGFGPSPTNPEPMVLEVQWEQPPPAPEPQATPTLAPVQPQVRTEQPRRTASKPASKAAPAAVSSETSPEGADTPPEMAQEIGQDVSVPTAAPAGPSGEHLVPLIKVEPTYPPQALLRRIEGAVTLEFGVTAAGTVADIQIVQAHPARLFEEPARTALTRWQFAPDAGQPHRRGRITMEFRIRS